MSTTRTSEINFNSLSLLNNYYLKISMDILKKSRFEYGNPDTSLAWKAIWAEQVLRDCQLTDEGKEIMKSFITSKFLNYTEEI